MHSFTDEEIASEAYSLWEAEGRPLWGRDEEFWFRAIENLRGRRAVERRFDPDGTH